MVVFITLLSNNTIGFGKDYSALFYSYKNEIVENIWMINVWDIDNTKVCYALNEIGEKWNLLLMDWEQLYLVDLKNKNEIEMYLNDE